jgi:hypothetical protein
MNLYAISNSIVYFCYTQGFVGFSESLCKELSVDPVNPLPECVPLGIGLFVAYFGRKAEDDVCRFRAILAFIPE